MPDRRRQQLRIREEISSTEEHAWPAARLTSVLMPATRRENQLRCQWAGSPDPHPASIPDCRCSFCTVLAPSRAQVRGPGTQGTAHSQVLAGSVTSAVVLAAASTFLTLPTSCFSAAAGGHLPHIFRTMPPSPFCAVTGTVPGGII